MDYEKAYNEMVQRCKELHEAGNALTKKQMEIVCPELAESEDERNWKKVEQAIKGFFKFTDADELLAWLEKQKEQKPMLFVPKFHVGDKVISTKNEHLTYEILEVGHINELGNPDYQVEIFGDGKRGVNGKFPNESPNIKYIECQKMDEWGKLLSEQKPAEWSEEDIDRRVNERARKSGTTKTEMDFYRLGIKDTLKSLSPQPHLKPSEKQMKALYACINYLEDRPFETDIPIDNLRSLYDDLLKLK